MASTNSAIAEKHQDLLQHMDEAHRQLSEQVSASATATCSAVERVGRELLDYQAPWGDPDLCFLVASERVETLLIVIKTVTLR